jgi:hypothetical protein
MCIRKFGWSQSGNLSRYVVPDIREDGCLIACGLSKLGHINLWDIRYAKLDQPSQVLLHAHGKAKVTFLFFDLQLTSALFIVLRTQSAKVYLPAKAQVHHQYQRGLEYGLHQLRLNR